MRDVCPWYVSAAAVRRFMELGGPADFDDASDELIEMAAETWRRYQAAPERKPKISRTGAYVYRGPGPLRLQFVVSMVAREEGEKPQVVDLWGASGDRTGRSAEGQARQNELRRERKRARDGGG